MSKKQGLLLGHVLVLTIFAAFSLYQSTYGASRQPAIEKRDRFVKELKAQGLSIRQISRLTGLSFGIVRKL
ncbi:hypothetical protein SDC9_210288 [bioreactor metagenome]|uniref:Resolvase HTH domain-containing protein n=1 Tax=bioreactor metagenome TaxID=1076179 RepID=A0A645JIL7_9ZZZZ